MGNNYKVILQFDGTHYSGWQYQNQQIKTIQGEIMRALKIIAKKRVVVTGSSRTDAGVHSTGLTANFFLPINIEADSLKRALNSLLPPDIRVAQCLSMEKSFNARYNVVSKTYVYRIFFGQVQSPFSYRYAAYIPYPLQLAKMRRALKHFIGQKDFSSFTSDEPQKNRFREITEMTMRVKGEEIVITVKGRSFLRYMVRNIVGTLIDVGRGKIQPEEIPMIFAAKDRRKAGRTAPSRGLTLERVEY